MLRLTVTCASLRNGRNYGDSLCVAEQSEEFEELLQAHSHWGARSRGRGLRRFALGLRGRLDRACWRRRSGLWRRRRLATGSRRCRRGCNGGRTAWGRAVGGDGDHRGRWLCRLRWGQPRGRSVDGRRERWLIRLVQRRPGPEHSSNQHKRGRNAANEGNSGTSSGPGRWGGGFPVFAFGGRWAVLGCGRQRGRIGRSFLRSGSVWRRQRTRRFCRFHRGGGECPDSFFHLCRSEWRQQRSKGPHVLRSKVAVFVQYLAEKHSLELLRNVRAARAEGYWHCVGDGHARFGQA